MTSTTRLFLLRHGEVEERYQRVFGGRIDMELSPRGHEQATALAQYLRGRSLHSIYASPMKRVQQTLAPLITDFAGTPTVMSDLREVDFGDWTGLGWDEVHARYNVSAFQWLHRLEEAAIPNAECGRTFRSRVDPCLRKIISNHAGQSVAIFCHGGVIRMCLAILLDWPLPQMAAFEIENASVTRIDLHPHKTEVHMVNFVPWRDLA